MSTHLQNVSSFTQCRPPVGFSDYEPINYENAKKFKTVKNTKENVRPRSISRQSRCESEVRSRTPMRASGSISRLSRLEDLDLRSLRSNRSTSRNPEDTTKSKKDEKKDDTLKKEAKKKEEKEKKNKSEN
jgi:hypothetical protein